MAEEELSRKRHEIEYSTERMAYHRSQMEAVPRLRALYRYWLHYFIARRAQWQTDLWLETLRDVTKPEVREGVTDERADAIRDELDLLERQRRELLSDLRETWRLAVTRGWRVAYPREYPTMKRWISATYGRMAGIAHWMREILRELPPPPPPPAKLHRIKIRLYNMERAPTPKGMFQGWFDIDALLDPDTEMPDLTWWLTALEIEIAKYHFVGYFKGMAKWHSPSQVSFAYFDEPTGIPYEEKTATYLRKKTTGEPFIKNIPKEFIAKAGKLTIGELIVGESSVAPEPNPDPKPENMGVYFQQVMIVKGGGIAWQERRDRWTWHPTNKQVKRVEEDLRIGGRQTRLTGYS